MSENSGLYEKYEVYKDGEAVPNGFVLEPESDPAAREALIRYADATDDHELAVDLRMWMDDLCDRDVPDRSDWWKCLDCGASTVVNRDPDEGEPDRYCPDCGWSVRIPRQERDGDA